MICSRKFFMPLFIACAPTCTLPMSILKIASKRVLPAALASGAVYFGLTNDGRKTRSSVWEAAQKIKAHTTETATSIQNWLDTKFGEQKDEHSLMINLLAELQKTSKRLKTRQNTTLDEIIDMKTQQTTILDKISDLEIMVVALQQRDTPTQTEVAPFSTRGGIVIETEEAGF